MREGKSPGAFSHPTVPSAHPYILMNYQGKARDVMTLAHELGHGVHQVLAAPLGPLLAPTPLTLAETASVFGEMLTFKALLASSRRPQGEKGPAGAEGRGHDQHGRAPDRLLLLRAARARGAPGGRADIGAARAKSGSRCRARAWDRRSSSTEGYESYWSYVPHFMHSPFYVYAYAFGDCLVNSLYGLYQDAHPGFVAKYFAMLEAGGSKHHSELLAPFGLDASQARVLAQGPEGDRGHDRRAGAACRRRGLHVLHGTTRIASRCLNKVHARHHGAAICVPLPWPHGRVPPCIVASL